MKISNLCAAILGLMAVMTWSLPASAEHRNSDSASLPAATVNGVSISEKALNAEMAGFVSKGMKISRNNALEAMIRTELLRQQAVHSGLDKNKDVRMQVELSRHIVLANAALKAYLAKEPVSSDDINKEYRLQMQLMPDKQYHLYDIHVSTASEARKIIRELSDGKRFADVAHAHAGEKQNSNGDIGWYALDALVPEIRGAVSALKTGAITQSPIRVGNFWHVIKLAGTRDMKKPALSKIRSEIKNIVIRKREKSFVETLRKNSKVVIN